MIYRAELSHHDLHAGYFGGPWLKPPRHRAPAHTPGRERRRDIDRLMTELFHLGALGKEDQLGTMNLITAEKRRRAYSLVKEGGPVSLARPGQKTVVVDNPDPFIQKMTPTGLDNPGQSASDTYTVSYHGQAHSHMDSLGIVLWRQDGQRSSAWGYFSWFFRLARLYTLPISIIRLEVRVEATSWLPAYDLDNGLACAGQHGQSK
jgi:hypothetical protein